MGHKGHYGEYSGNAKWSRDHAHTKVTKEDYKASERDDAAHIDYLKRDVLDDQKSGGKYKDENQTADEKHISKLEGDMKYDKEHHGSPAKQVTTGIVEKFKKDTDKVISKASKIKVGEIRGGWNPDQPAIGIYRKPKITNKKPKSKELGDCLPGGFGNCFPEAIKN